MGKTVGNNPAHALLLQSVVTDGRRRIERFPQIAGFKNLFLLHAVSPYTGKAIGLQFLHNGKPVRLGALCALLELAYLPGDTKLVLDMMAHLMGKDITQREVASAPELAFHILIER